MLGESQRRVVTEMEILQQECPKCHAAVAFGCHNKARHALAGALGSTELTFHRERINAAYVSQMDAKFAGIMNRADKQQIVYFAFIMQCESMAAKAKEIFGKDFDSLTIQKFFVKAAIDELLKYNMLDDPALVTKWAGAIQ